VIVAALARAGETKLPLLLHVGGAMVMFGAVGAACLLAWAAVRRESPALARSTFLALLAAALPAWVIFRVGAEWIYSKGYDTPAIRDQLWVGIGFIVSDAGLVVLLVTTGLAYWWTRRGGVRIPRWVAGLTSIYLAAITVAWLAMAGKWS
jgi:hypothetical protein